MRTLVTWVVDGTEIKGKPLVEVFPEVEEWMLENYNPEGRTVIESFRMESMPYVLQSATPVTFSFHFDEAAIQAYFEQEAGMYEQIDRMYKSTWEDYIADATPLWEQVQTVNQYYKGEFERVDQTLETQATQTLADIEHWWNDSFTVTTHYLSLSAKAMEPKRAKSHYTTYAAIAGTALAATAVASIAQRRGKAGKDFQSA